MLTLKVALKDAQKAKNYLLDLGIYDKKYKAKKQDFIFFPLLKKLNSIVIDFKFEYDNIELEEIQENNYQEFLKDKIPEKYFSDLPNSYDMIGSIIIIDINENLKEFEKIISDSLLKTHKSIKTILKKIGIHEGEFRTQKLKYLAGINTKETIYKENNTMLKLNVEKVYFSSRLSTERKRIYKQINFDEEILVMFSGCGPYPLIISKNSKAKNIIGIEKNPIAHKYALENVELNKVKNIKLYNGDVKLIVPKLTKKFHRIIMPLPKNADTFLEYAFMVSKKNTIIHLYDFVDEKELNYSKDKVKKKANLYNIKYDIIKTVKCGQYSPGKFRICLDIIIH